MTATKKSAPAMSLATRPTRPVTPSQEQVNHESTADGGILRIHYLNRADLPAVQLVAWDALWRRLLGGGGDG